MPVAAAASARICSCHGIAMAIQVLPRIVI